MPIDILMPALSPTMEEGNLAKWLVKEGDSVAPGDVIAEIETDKATMEVEAVDEGVVGKILVPEGAENVKVNTVIAALLGEGESADDIKDSGQPAAATETNRKRRLSNPNRRQSRPTRIPRRRLPRPRSPRRLPHRSSLPAVIPTCPRAPKWSR